MTFFLSYWIFAIPLRLEFEYETIMKMIVLLIIFQKSIFLRSFPEEHIQDV